MCTCFAFIQKLDFDRFGQLIDKQLTGWPSSSNYGIRNFSEIVSTTSNFSVIFNHFRGVHTLIPIVVYWHSWSNSDCCLWLRNAPKLAGSLPHFSVFIPLFGSVISLSLACTSSDFPDCLICLAKRRSGESTAAKWTPMRTLRSSQSHATWCARCFALLFLFSCSLCRSFQVSDCFKIIQVAASLPGHCFQGTWFLDLNDFPDTDTKLSSGC